MNWPTRTVAALACVAGLSAIVLVTVGNAATAPALSQTEYILTPTNERGLTGGSAEGPVSHLLTTRFTMRIPGRLKAQRVVIDRVQFFSEQDELLGFAEVSGITVVDEGAGGTQPAVSSRPIIAPLTDGVIRFDATLEDATGLAPGTKIYSRVEGSAGSTGFRAISAASPAVAA
ncbi:MAG: hypothetical protein ACT4OM_01135 [Actinomycetota bacterium]